MSKVLRALEEEAKDEGRVEGRVEGSLEAMRVAAKKLLLKGMSIKEIVEITGLPIEEIRKLGGLN